jgi:hypothetical protein
MMKRKTKLSLAVLLASAGLAASAFRLHHRPSTLRAEDLAAAYAENPSRVDHAYRGRELTLSGGQAMCPATDCFCFSRRPSL